MSSLIIDCPFGRQANVGQCEELLGCDCSIAVRITSIMGTLSVTGNAWTVNLKQSIESSITIEKSIE